MGAAREDGSATGESKVVGCVAGLFASVVVALAVALIGPLAGMNLVPDSARVAAPFVCPAGYDHSRAVLVRTSSSSGKSSSHPELYCAMDPGGAETRVGDGKLFFVGGLAYAVLALAAMAVGLGAHAVLDRWRRRP